MLSQQASCWHQRLGLLAAACIASAVNAPLILAQTSPNPAVYRGLDADQFMKTWLVLGPLPVFESDARPQDLEAQKKAFATDFLTQHAGEAGIRPRAGLAHTITGKEHQWQLVESKSDVVNLMPHEGPKDFAIAYAWAEIELPESRPALLGLGSDDAVKVWLNGKLVHENWTARGVVKDDDLVRVDLEKGTNRLLLKIQNQQGPWGFVCRLVRPGALAEKLVTAAMRSDLDAIKLALANGADANARHNGLTALQAARIQGDQELADFLIANGADTNAPMPAPEAVIDARLRETALGESSGVVALAAREGKILFEKGYGYASLELGVPATPQTRFRIGSITKQFTAAAILRLQEQGKLSVTDKLAKFIPDYPRGEEVTLHHLLTHTSGIHSYTSKPNFLETAPLAVKPEDLIQSFKDDPYDFSPGEKYLYNNSGFFLLGYIVAKVSGQSYAAFLRQEFFEPLGMTNTGVHEASAILKHEATGYSCSGGELRKALNWDMSRAGGAGALYSTVEDLFRWNEAVFGGKVLSDASLKAAFTPVVTKEDTESAGQKETGYGYGWAVGKTRGLRTIEHGGGLHGFLSYLLRFPEQKFTVVVLANASDPPPNLVPSSLAQEIARLYLWREMKPRAVPRVATSVNPATYDALVGRYDYGNAILTVTKDGNRLFAQLAGQPKFEIFPKSETEFFWKVVEAEVTFVKNEKGDVTKAIHRQGGQTITAAKLADVAIAKVDPALYDAYVGKYNYGGAVATVTKEGNRLFVQLTGQPKMEVFPKSETEFFWQVVNAKVTFVKDETGKVVKAIHEQAGRKIDAPKIE